MVFQNARREPKSLDFACGTGGLGRPLKIYRFKALTHDAASNTRQSGLASENGKIRTFSSKRQNCALICTAICRVVSSGG
jgi:hypothetical protein